MDAILLDIDVFADGHIPEKDEDLWEQVGRMRNYKNEIFESCVTDEARKLFS